MKLSITTFAAIILVLTNVIVGYFDPSYRVIHQSFIDITTCYGLYLLHKVVE